MSYRIIVTGSRNWRSERTVWDALKEAADGKPDVTVVHGDCPTGADQMADQWAQFRLGVSAERHPADWDKHGKAAGPIRNREMVELGADVCLAFPHADSRGTKHCMKCAEDAGIPVVNLGDK